MKYIKIYFNAQSINTSEVNIKINTTNFDMIDMSESIQHTHILQRDQIVIS